MKKTFLELVERAFDEKVTPVKEDTQKIIQNLRDNALTEAQKIFETSPASKLDAYVDQLRNTDYVSLILTMLREQRPRQPSPEKPAAISLSYLKKAVPKLLEQYGYVSGRLVDSAKASTGGRMLSMYAKQLGIKLDPASAKADEKHFVSTQKPKQKEHREPRKIEHEGKGLTRLIIDYMDERERLDPVQFCKDYELKGFEHTVAMRTAKIYKPQGWEQVIENGRKVYEKLQLTDARISEYIGRILEVTQTQDRFHSSDIDPKHPELFERFVSSQIAGNGTFLEREGLGVTKIRGKNVYFFKGGPGEPRTISQTYLINSDGTLHVGSGEPYKN